MFLALTLAAATVPPSPASEWAACLADAATLPPGQAEYTRYQTFFAVPEARRAGAYKVWVSHLWGISLEAEPPRPRRVTDTVYALDIRDYGWDRYVYGRLFYRDPHFHAGLTADGKTEAARTDGFWIPEEAARALKGYCGTEVPLLRADWFFAETSIQEGRGEPGRGTGYYDFLGVKSRDDFLRLIGSDPREAERLKREWRAVVRDSGVAHFPRQVVRLGANDGGHWFTLDVLDDGTGDRNALRRFDREFKHQAEEHYGIGPAGLPVYLLCDEKGVLQASAPDKIGPDTTRRGRRKTIDVNTGCISCHTAILQPLDSWLDETLRAPLTAEVPYEQSVRLRQLYFRGRQLKAKLDLDAAAFAARLRECNGLEPAEWSKLYRSEWDAYFEGRLTLEDCARELGCTPERFRQALSAVTSQKRLDPVFADLMRFKNGTVRREHWDEAYALAQLYLLGKP